MLSCAFDPRGCQHVSLFLNEYKRTNRTKGTKILRCFPHCCPEHVNRSYCGSALHIQLTSQSHKRPRADASSPQESTLSTENLVMFAHFEEAEANPYRINDVVASDVVMNSIQTEQNPKGEWIEGLPHERLDNTTHIYQINPGARWYYEWESAATKAQRFTKHVLRVYVFQKEKVGDVVQLRIVSIARSSEFMVVSYRRAPSEIQSERHRLASLSDRGDDMWEKDELAASLRRKMIAIPASVYSSPGSDGRGRPRCTFTGSREEQQFWRFTNMDALKSAKSLAVIHLFMSATNASNFVPSLRQWSALFGRRFAESMAHKNGGKGPNDSQIAAYMKTMTWQFLRSTEANPIVPEDLARVVHMCMEVAAWVLLDESNRALLQRFLADSAHVLLDKSQLRSAYLKWSTTLHDLVDRFLRARFGSPICQLIEDVVATIFRYDQYKGVRPELMELLSSTSSFGLASFVSQARTHYVAFHQAGKRKRDQGTAPMTDILKGMSGQWLFDGQHAAVASTSTAQVSMSLGGALNWLRELGALAIESNGELLCLSSMWSISSTDAGMNLVLDGRRRIFQRFPSGLSSTIPQNGRVFGDYRGQVIGRDTVMLEFVAWPAESTTALESHTQMVYRWKFRLQAGCHEHDNEARVLVVDGAVEHGHCQVSGRVVNALSIEEKRSAVSGWSLVSRIKGVYNAIV